MPLLRITCPAELTERVIHLLRADGRVTELTVIPAVSHLTGGDLILADVPRSTVDGLLEQLPDPHQAEGLHVSVEPSERLVPVVVEASDDAVIWAQVDQEVHDVGRLSWVNISLIVIAAMIAAIGILEDQLLLIVGAMALSPDYYPIADTCLGIVRREWRRALGGAATLIVAFAAGAVGAYLLTTLLRVTGLVTFASEPPQQLTLFISRPDALSVVVALLAGVAGAIAITLPDARGLVGVFVSITTIPAAANIGVALAAGRPGEMVGAAVQLGFNVVSLLLAGCLTLSLRRYLELRDSLPLGDLAEPAGE